MDIGRILYGHGQRRKFTTSYTLRSDHHCARDRLATVRKVSKDARTARQEQANEILKVAREEDEFLKGAMEAKLEAVKSQLANLELNVNKDLEHLKETYSGEIRNLGQKIEDLRSELKNQHGQLVGLLTEMIKKSR